MEETELRQHGVTPGQCQEPPGLSSDGKAAAVTQEPVNLQWQHRHGPEGCFFSAVLSAARVSVEAGGQWAPDLRPL